MQLRKAAILGATGPTGIHLSRELARRGVCVRVVSRSEQRLQRAFPDAGVERTPANLLDEKDARRAIEGCDVAFDCIGLPADKLHEHAVTAKVIAKTTRECGTRCMQVSSFWSYLPIGRLPLDETHPRAGGPEAVVHRRAAEEVLQAAGAAIVNLPDFFGPNVHVSALQQALAEAAAGKTINWVGDRRTERDHIYVPDAMRSVAELAARDAAYGERWIFAGSGPLSLERLLDIAGTSLGRKPKARTAGVFMLRVLSLFMKSLRDFMPMVPYYAQPISYNDGKLRAIIGPQERTPYETAIPRTIEWLRGQA